MWEARRKQLEHEIEILEDVKKKMHDKGCSVMEVGEQISKLQGKLKDLAVQQHHQAQ
jgi:hypothetical protein